MEIVGDCPLQMWSELLMCFQLFFVFLIKIQSQSFAEHPQSGIGPWCTFWHRIWGHQWTTPAWRSPSENVQTYCRFRPSSRIAIWQRLCEVILAVCGARKIPTHELRITWPHTRALAKLWSSVDVHGILNIFPFLEKEERMVLYWLRRMYGGSLR